jgi:phosphoribosylformimino-5-aminoimidazole carboxamide ribonucleotide (ProFAR) isomerase
VRRIVVSHGGLAEAASLADRAHTWDMDVLVAGGVRDIDAIGRLRDAGIAGIILGEALLSGAIDFPAALEAAA